MLVGVLGPLQVDGRPAALSPRDRVVLSALALGGGSASAPDVLAEALWADSPPSTWSKVLQGAIVRLRRSLGREAIESVAGGYRLAINESELDAAAFAALVTRARALAVSGDPARSLVTLDNALGLWRGTPYSDLLNWSRGHHESLRLEELRQSAEEERVQAGLACGRAVELVAVSQQLVADEPQRELRWQLLASALYGAGRQTEALEVLRRAKTVLREELGLDPGPDLAEFERAVLRHDTMLPRSSRVPRASSRCPYPGLLPFEEADADSFAGRESDIAACVRRLGEQPLLVVAGASGCGKSSLVRAGVVPALRRSGREVVLLPPGPGGAARLAALRETTQPRVGLVVDQLEEMTATGGDREEVVALLECIAAWCTDGPVIVVVRTDRLDDLGSSPALAALAARGVHLVTAMPEGDMRRAIERPAETAGLFLESSLVDVLLRDVGEEPGSLPHLSHALRETWEQRERDVLTVAAYNATGGIRGAVAQTAEDVYARLNEHERLALRGLMVRLVVSPPGGLLVAARLPHGHISERPDVGEILGRLIAARLLTVDEENIALAHASLATSWPRLRQWIVEDAAGLQLMAHLQTSADGWDASGRPDSELYRGDRLHRTLEWTDLRHPVLGPVESEFLDRARTFERAEQEHAADEERIRRRIRRRRLLSAGVAAALLVGVTTLVTTYTRSPPSTSPALVAANEDALLVSHRDSTGLTNLFVVRPDGSGERPLMPSRVLPGTHVQNGEWSPDGTQVVFETLQPSPTDGAEAETWIVDADGGDARRVASCSTAPCRQFGQPAWSPDGERLALIRADLYPDGACCSTHVEVLDLATRSRAEVLEVRYSPDMSAWETLGSPSWSPDGRQLVLTLETYALEAPYPIIGSQLAVVSATGPRDQRPTPITDVSLAAYAPNWHPTEDLIAFSTRNPDTYPRNVRSDIYTVRTDGSDLRRLTEAPSGVADRYLVPTWTADGSRLAMTIAYVGVGEAVLGMVPAFLPATGGRPTPLNDTGRGTDVKPRPVGS